MNPESGSGQQPNPMLPALARWRGWPRSPRPARRWRIADRFRTGRTDDRWRPAGTVFRRDGRAVHLVSHHLTLRPLTYAPWFQLAFHAHGQPVPPAATQSRERREEPVRMRSRLVTASLEPADRNRPGVQTDVSLTPHRSPTFAPVSGVVARRSGAATEPVIREVAESVIERIVRSHQRIESRQRTSVVIREQPKVAVEVERAMTSFSKRASESPIEMPSMGTTWPANNGFMAPQGPELDQLTDQIVRKIDDRLTAQRERMGRW